MIKEPIKFRASSFGHLMSNPQGKTNAEKYLITKAEIEKLTKEYSLLNTSTKTAANKLEKIKALNTKLLELEKVKDEIQLSDTCIKQLLRIYAQEKYSRREELKNKYLDKGNERENDAITLLARTLKKPFKKNTTRLRNDFFQGEPDVYLGESIENADETLDTKCSFSLLTFLDAKFSDLNFIYEAQGQVYMDLTGAKKHTVAYCLINSPAQIILDEIRKLSWKMGVLDASVEENPDFVKAVKQIERNHIFDIKEFMIENPYFEIKNKHDFDQNGNYIWDFDIPYQERIHLKSFILDDSFIKEMKDRAVLCRKWMLKNLNF